MGYGEQIGSFAGAIGQVGCSADVYSHAVSELSKALNGYGSSLPCRQPTVKSIVMMSIVRKPVLKVSEIKNATLTIDGEKIDWDVLEKNFGPFNKGDIVFHKDGWNFN